MNNLFKTKFDAAVIVLIPACIGINYLGKLFASVLKDVYKRQCMRRGKRPADEEYS